MLLLFVGNIGAETEEKKNEKEKIRPLDYYYLEKETSGRGRCFNLNDFFLWNDRMVVKSGEDFYYFSEGSNELERIKIDGIGKILDMDSRQGIPYVFGVDKDGYELRYNKEGEWISEKLPDNLENSFEVDEFHLLSDIDTLILFSKYKVFINKNGDWTEKEVPKINFELGDYLPDQVSDEEIDYAILLDDMIFAGWDFGEWGGGVMSLNLKDSELKWKSTEVKGSIVGLVKTSDRNVWAGMWMANLSDDKSESLFQYRDGKWTDYFQSVNYNKDEELFLWMDFSEKTSISLSDKGELLIISSFLGVFKIVDEKMEQLVDWEGKLFNPYIAIEKDGTVYLSTNSGHIAKYNIDEKRLHCLWDKEDDIDSLGFDLIDKGDIEKIKNINNENDYSWDKKFINYAIREGQDDIAKYLINGSNIIHRCKKCIDLSLMDIQTIKELLKKGYMVRLSDIGSIFKSEEAKKFLLENVKIIDEKPYKIDKIIKGIEDKELILFYLNNGYDLKYKTRHEVSVLHETDSVEIAKILILLGADVNVMSSPMMNYGETPLIKASKTGNFEMVKLLVENGAYVSLPDATGNTALFYANEKGPRFQFPTMVSHGWVSGFEANYKKTREYLKVAEKRITKEERESVSKLLEKYRLSPKHAEFLNAVSKNDLKKAEAILKSMEDIHVKDIRDFSVLRAALSPSSFEIKDRRVILKKEEKCNDRNLKMLKIIAENSMSRDGKIIDEYEVMDELAYCNDIEALKMLVDMGADVNAKDRYGSWTILNGVLNSFDDKKDYETAKFLIMNGADINVVSGMRTTLNHAAKNDKLYEIIRSMGGKTLEEIKKEKRKKRLERVKYK